MLRQQETKTNLYSCVRFSGIKLAIDLIIFFILKGALVGSKLKKQTEIKTFGFIKDQRLTSTQCSVKICNDFANLQKKSW